MPFPNLPDWSETHIDMDQWWNTLPLWYYPQNCAADLIKQKQ